MHSFVLRSSLLAAPLFALVHLAGCAEAPARPPEVAVSPPPPLPVVVAPPVAAPPSVSLPPTMAFENFLPQYEDAARREWLWKVFQAGEREAWTFAATPDRWVPLTRVDYVTLKKKAGDWKATGLIETQDPTDTGVFFHETFHTAYHRSVLHQGKDRYWAEAFCDAFRFAAEHDLLPPPPSRWTTRIIKSGTLSFDEALQGAHNKLWVTMYAYPATLVIKRSGGTIPGLRALWFQVLALRAQQGTDVLDAFFGYSPRDATKANPTEPTAPPLHTGESERALR